MNILIAFIIGLIFSCGLMISGMVNPEKVLNFLDVTGDWDASLGFVMAGAVLVTFIGYRIVLSSQHPWFSQSFSLPTKTAIDMRLVGGAALFGIGWGLVGICPGPALAVLAAVPSKAIIFFVAMLVGMYAARWIAIRSDLK